MRIILSNLFPCSIEQIRHVFDPPPERVTRSEQGEQGEHSSPRPSLYHSQGVSGECVPSSHWSGAPHSQPIRGPDLPERGWVNFNLRDISRE